MSYSETVHISQQHTAAVVAVMRILLEYSKNLIPFEVAVSLKSILVTPGDLTRRTALVSVKVISPEDVISQQFYILDLKRAYSEKWVAVTLHRYAVDGCEYGIFKPNATGGYSYQCIDASEFPESLDNFPVLPSSGIQN